MAFWVWSVQRFERIRLGVSPCRRHTRARTHTQLVSNTQTTCSCSASAEGPREGQQHTVTNRGRCIYVCELGRVTSFWGGVFSVEILRVCVCRESGCRVKINLRVKLDCRVMMKQLQPNSSAVPPRCTTAITQRLHSFEFLRDVWWTFWAGSSWANLTRWLSEEEDECPKIKGAAWCYSSEPTTQRLQTVQTSRYCLP